jgi:hypothetical protein
MTITAFLMLTLSISMLVLPATNAHDPVWKVRAMCLSRQTSLASAKMCLLPFGIIWYRQQQMVLTVTDGVSK